MFSPNLHCVHLLGNDHHPLPLLSTTTSHSLPDPLHIFRQSETLLHFNQSTRLKSLAPSVNLELLSLWTPTPFDSPKTLVMSTNLKR
jgi:hypothetical protein